MTMEIMNEKNIYSISKISQQNPRVLCIFPQGSAIHSEQPGGCGCAPRLPTNGGGVFT